MSRHLKLTVLAAVVAAVLAGGAQADTLGDAITLAYESNPTLQAERARQRALDETYVQAEAGYGPSVSLQGALGQDRSSALQLFQPLGESSRGAIQLTQPLYTGGRVASQVSAAEATVLAGREGLRTTEQNVLQAVIRTYVDVRRDQESLAIARENLGLLRRQLEESQARFEVGEITRTDVAQTQARVAGAQSQVAAAQATLATSRASYAAVVGQNPGDLAPEPGIAKFLPGNLDQAFDAAEHDNPILRQAKFTERASAARVAAAKAERRPTVSLQASLGYSGGSVGPGSPFTNYNRDITATAVASFPLLTAGLTSSQIRQAAQVDTADRIGIEVARRQALLSVSQAWDQLLGARAGLAANEEEVKAANIAFEGTRQEAQVGLRNTLDVLITEQQLANAELAVVATRHDEYVAAISLLAAMGDLSPADLVPGIGLYDPRTNFDRVRRVWPFPLTPWAPVVGVIDHLGAPAIP